MQTIEEKLKIGRSETVEFLTTIDEVVDLAKIAVSFANNNGGSIFVGVNPKGKLIGVLPESELKLVEEINDFIDGKMTLESIIHTVKHYFILEICISKSTLPLILKTNNTLCYYYRLGMNTVEANKIIVSFLNMRKFQKLVMLTSEHIVLLDIMNVEMNLSTLYNKTGLKPKLVDKLLSELIYLDKVKIFIVDKSFYYSKK